LPGPSDSEEDAYFLECIRHYFRVPLTRCDLGPVGTASFVLSECLRKGELRALAGEELASIRIEALSAVQLGIGELRFRWENVASAYSEALAANS